MGVRLCFASPLLPDHKRLASGMYQFSGLAAEDVDRAMHFFYPLNVTQAVFVGDSIKCIDSIVNNSSDFAVIYVSISDEVSKVEVPVPIFTRKMFIVSGYNVTDLEQTTRSLRTTAMSNFEIFDPLSYIITLLLFVTLISILVTNYLINFKVNRNEPRWRVICSLIWSKFKKMSRKMRSVRLMIALLAFLVMIHFEILYKTEQVVGEKPVVIDSYQKLLSLPDAFPIFFDGIFPDSSEFKFAPADSIKGKIWQRLLDVKKNQSELAKKDSSQALYLQMVPIASQVIRMKAAVIDSYQTSSVVSGVICSSSDEHELWQTVLNSDPSENENLVGWPIRDSFESFTRLKVHFRHLAESGIVIHYYQNVNSEFTYEVLRMPVEHVNKQKRLCRGYEKGYSDTNDRLSPLALNYYSSFIKFILSLSVMSSMALYLEVFFKLL